MSRMLWNAILVLLATVALAACGSPAPTANGGGSGNTGAGGSGAGLPHLVTVKVELLAELVPNLDEAGLIFSVNGGKGDDPEAPRLTYAQALASPPQFDTVKLYRGAHFNGVVVDLDFPTYYAAAVVVKAEAFQSANEVVAKMPIARDLNGAWSCTEEDYENGKLVDTLTYSPKLHLEASDAYYTVGIQGFGFNLLGNKIFGDDIVSGQVDDPGTKFQFTYYENKISCNR